MSKDILLHPVLISLAIFVIAFCLKVLVDKLARHGAKKQRDIRYISHNIKHFINLVVVLLLLFVWSTEIQNFALSVAAFAVADAVCHQRIYSMYYWLFLLE